MLELGSGTAIHTHNTSSPIRPVAAEAIKGGVWK